MIDPAFALLASVLTPVAGAVMVVVTGTQRPHGVRRMALVASLITLALAMVVVCGFDFPGRESVSESIGLGKDGSVAQYETRSLKADGSYAASEFVWVPASTGIDIRFSIGLDGLSLWMYALSAILTVTSVLVSWHAVQERSALFYSMLLLLEAGCLGVFAARDIMLFYVCFEFTLIPLFFLIGIWGSEDRRHAATKFFLYTLVGSLFTFLGLLTIVLWNHSQSVALDGPNGAPTSAVVCSISQLLSGLSDSPLPYHYQRWVFLALFAGFAIKVPLFPLHTWLPLAHVQAPTAGSVFLAGILLKIGTYGFLRFSIPMLPMATAAYMPWIIWLSVIGIIYGAMVALVQSDMKRLVAYSSVSHLGFCTLGLFALNPLGVQGAALQMVNHGISTGALFALIGMLYERYHTREIADYGGLARRLPWTAFFVLLFTLSSIGLPGMNGFAGEIMVLVGAFQRAWLGETATPAVHLRWASITAVAGVVLGAWYMLSLVQRVFWGELKEPPTNERVKDLSMREIAALLPLAILVFWIGLYPKFFLDRMAPALADTSAAAISVLQDEQPVVTGADDSATIDARHVTAAPTEKETGRAY